MQTSFLNKRIYAEEVAIVLIILSALGFPGELSVLIGGEIIETVFEYACFVIEVLLILFLLWRERGAVVRRELLVYLFVAVIVVESLLVTNYFSEQVVSCIRFAFSVVFGVLVAKKYGAAKLVSLACVAQGVVVFSTAVLCFVRPSAAFEDTTLVANALDGLFTTKNVCGGELAFGVVLAILNVRFFKESPSKGIFSYWFVVLQFTLLALTQAFGPLFYAVIVAAYIILWPPGRRFSLAATYLIVSFGFLILALYALPVFAPVLEYFGKDATLTGRTDLWNQSIYVILHGNTLTGYGYGMFWRDPSAYEQIQEAFSSYSFLGNVTSGAHNALIDLALNAGLIGVGLLLVVIISIIPLLKKADDKTWMAGSSIMLYLILIGLTERFFVVFSFKVLFFFIVIGLCLRCCGQQRTSCQLLAEGNEADPEMRSRVQTRRSAIGSHVPYRLRR